MNRDSPKAYDSKAAAALFAQGRYDDLADIYLTGIQAFSRSMVRRIDGAARPVLNRFVGDFLFYFSQPDFRPSTGRLRRFLDLNRAIGATHFNRNGAVVWQRNHGFGLSGFPYESDYRVILGFGYSF